MTTLSNNREIKTANKRVFRPANAVTELIRKRPQTIDWGVIEAVANRKYTLEAMTRADLNSFFLDVTEYFIAQTDFNHTKIEQMSGKGDLWFNNIKRGQSSITASEFMQFARNAMEWLINNINPYSIQSVADGQYPLEAFGKRTLNTYFVNIAEFYRYITLATYADIEQIVGHGHRWYNNVREGTSSVTASELAALAQQTSRSIYEASNIREEENTTTKSGIRTFRIDKKAWAQRLEERKAWKEKNKDKGGDGIS